MILFASLSFPQYLKLNRDHSHGDLQSFSEFKNSSQFMDNMGKNNAKCK